MNRYIAHDIAGHYFHWYGNGEESIIYVAESGDYFRYVYDTLSSLVPTIHDMTPEDHESLQFHWEDVTLEFIMEGKYVDNEPL